MNKVVEIQTTDQPERTYGETIDVNGHAVRLEVVGNKLRIMPIADDVRIRLDVLTQISVWLEVSDE